MTALDEQILRRCWSLTQPPCSGATIIIERDFVAACGDAIERLSLEFALSSQQAAALRDERDCLRSALVHAVSVIREWHNMEINTKDRSAMWDIYWRNALEMKPIREALAPTARVAKQVRVTPEKAGAVEIAGTGEQP